LFIQTEDTPNPNALKFIPGQAVLSGDIGVVDYKKGADVSSSPLAKRLFQIDGVDGVFLGSDFLSITKSEKFDWYVLKPSILGVIMEHFINGIPVYNGSGEQTHSDDDPLSRQIREIIDTKVRPSVAMDGGDIQFESFEDGVVYLSMYGACSGCPSSTATLKSGIENMLKYYVPEVQEVRQYAR
jgi:Fe-S cluster biogenesis protein NfuA